MVLCKSGSVEQFERTDQKPQLNAHMWATLLTWG